MQTASKKPKDAHLEDLVYATSDVSGYTKLFCVYCGKPVILLGGGRHIGPRHFEHVSDGDHQLCLQIREAAVGVTGQSPKIGRRKKRQDVRG
jgi:hypothetical protein